jgi:hypothetical protein
MRVPLLCLALVLFAGANAAAGELVVNGGFETGDFTGWTVSGADTPGWDYGISTNQPQSGTYSAWFGSPSGLTYLSQEIPTTPGQEYEISFWGAINNQGQPPDNEIQFYWNGIELLNGIDVPGRNWTFVETRVYATQDQTEAEFAFMNVPGWFAIDNVGAYAVPEPATLALGGAALALLAIGRRRARKA